MRMKRKSKDDRLVRMRSRTWIEYTECEWLFLLIYVHSFSCILVKKLIINRQLTSCSDNTKYKDVKRKAERLQKALQLKINTFKRLSSWLPGDLKSFAPFRQTSPYSQIPHIGSRQYSQSRKDSSALRKDCHFRTCPYSRWVHLRQKSFPVCCPGSLLPSRRPTWSRTELCGACPWGCFYLFCRWGALRGDCRWALGLYMYCKRNIRLWRTLGPCKRRTEWWL